MNWSKLNTKALTQRIGLSSKQKWCLKAVKARRQQILAALQERRSHLSFLNGLEGEFKAKKYKNLTHLVGDERSLFLHLEQQYLQSRGVKTKAIYDFNIEKVRYIQNGHIRETRIGKHLRNLYTFSGKPRKDFTGSGRVFPIVIANAIDSWENRPVDWSWYISTDPRDIYTMSTGRPWKSCMEISSYNISVLSSLNDRIADGSAILFFCRNSHVCGRMMIQPCASSTKKPILYINEIYGSGPPAPSFAKHLRQILSKVKTSEFSIQVHNYETNKATMSVGEFPWDEYDQSIIKMIDYAWREQPIKRSIL